MSEDRSEYGFPFFPFERGNTSTDIILIARMADEILSIICGMPREMSKLERAQTYAAEVRTRRNMIARRITEEVKPIVGSME